MSSVERVPNLVCGRYYNHNSYISLALDDALIEQESLEASIAESIDTIRSLTPECDALDYALAASSGMLCGVIDIFHVGSPKDSVLGKVSDKWVAERTKDFAKLCGWKQNGEDDADKSLKSAIKHLEKKFKIPYDQTGRGESGRLVFDLDPSNHHFKSLAHNPSILGLFFSVLDQFSNTSHFVSEGQLISLDNADGKFELQGHDVPSKLFCATVNWIGHLISDQSGSSGSKTRGMGIPSPLWTWTNDVIAIKSELKIPVSAFDKSINELALNIYKEGYDARFQAAQAIPVFINELVTRLMYSIRRLSGYLINTPAEARSFKQMWSVCEPFSNATVKRMLTVAHGTFCLLDIGDAAVRGVASGNVAEFAMRVNVVGVGRFTVSVAGEFGQSYRLKDVENEYALLLQKKAIVDDYMDGLKMLADVYDDSSLLSFVDDLQQSDAYKEAFDKTVRLSEKRGVDESNIYRTKEDVDRYFKGGRS
ncbi:hypothetical protein SAMN05216413_2270 [Ruminococcaceae bacterium KH2T8]|nr:hypothetical protein SAMN05216413_2270 [Ruminococcaceae bacterium KH2T8]